MVFAHSLQYLNTLGVRASARQLVAAESEAGLRRIVDSAADAGLDLLVLGGGSNVVLQRRFDGICCLMRMRGMRIDPLGPDTFAVTARAGEGWHALVRYCLGQGLFGLENLALIPGSVGAAPLQNIGAYGVELADRFLRLRAMDTRSGEVCEFDRSACRFGYRDSLFKSAEAGRYVIVEVTLQLSRRPEVTIAYPDLRTELQRLGWVRPTPVQVAEAVIRVRRRKLPDPRRIGNVGSFFKNPVVAADRVERLRRELTDLVVHEVAEGTSADGAHRFKLSAAQLIDRAGWKGARRDGVGVWRRQPLVLVNLDGHADGADFLAFSQEISADIQSRFGVTLELEPRVYGSG